MTTPRTNTRRGVVHALCAFGVCAGTTCAYLATAELPDDEGFGGTDALAGAELLEDVPLGDPEPGDSLPEGSDDGEPEGGALLLDDGGTDVDDAGGATGGAGAGSGSDEPGFGVRPGTAASSVAGFRLDTPVSRLADEVLVVVAAGPSTPAPSPGSVAPPVGIRPEAWKAVPPEALAPPSVAGSATISAASRTGIAKTTAAAQRTRLERRWGCSYPAGRLTVAPVATTRSGRCCPGVAGRTCKAFTTLSFSEIVVVKTHA